MTVLAGLGGLAKQLAIAAGRAVVDRVVELATGAVRQQDEPSQPLTYRHVEHNRAQERSAIEAAKRQQRDR